jgi:hypothetical protein
MLNEGRGRQLRSLSKHGQPMKETKRSAFAPGEKTEPKSNVPGKTPTIVTEVLFKLTVCPMMLRSP